MKKRKGYTLATILKVNKYTFKCCPYKYTFYILINLISIVQVVVALKATEFTTNAAYRLFTKTSKGFNIEVKTFLAYAAALAALYIISIIGQLVLKKISLEVSYSFERDLNLKLGEIKWDYYESHETSVKMHEVRTKSLESMLKLLNSIMFYITTFVSIFAYGFFLSQINIFVVFIYLAIIFLSTKLADRVFDEVREIWNEIQPFNQRQTYFFGISGDKTTHQEYRFNRLFYFVRDKWNKYFDDEYKLRIKIFKKFEITLQLARIILNIPYILMLGYVCYEVVIGKHEIGFLMLCKEMFNNIVNTFGSVQDYISNDKIESKFVKSFFDILKLDREAEIIENKSTHGDIIFNRVEFSYPQARVKSLKGVDFHIKAGEKIAIVGHNGSGKTTFTNLLMALTQSYSGDIALTEKEGDTFSRLRNSISCIFQDFAQYQMTIRENIQVGDTSRVFSDDDIIGLLDKVGLSEFVCSLPDGIDTKLGELDNGIELSKGQWQRIAIARLLANEKATIWILDEPTAYLDPISEIEIYDLIYKLSENRTVFFISHRLGFAKKADRIVVFDDGKIVEDGTHSELIKINEKYAEMYKNQEAWYAA